MHIDQSFFVFRAEALVKHRHALLAKPTQGTRRFFFSSLDEAAGRSTSFIPDDLFLGLAPLAHLLATPSVHQCICSTDSHRELGLSPILHPHPFSTFTSSYKLAQHAIFIRGLSSDTAIDFILFLYLRDIAGQCTKTAKVLCVSMCVYSTCGCFPVRLCMF